MARRLIFETCANCSKKIVDDEAALLLDDHNDLIFCSEECLRENFETEIEFLEEEMTRLRQPVDILATDFKKYENYLSLVLSQPDEIWEVDTVDEHPPLCFFIGEFLHEKEQIFYIAAAYLADSKPAFVYMHFPTRDPELVENYRRDQIIFDSSQDEESEISDNDVGEDNIAFALYEEMVSNRAESDIDEEEFPLYNDLKLPTVEKPEEIWRIIDDEGTTFLIYIAHYQTENEAVGYIVVAVEDDLSDNAVPVFGFPTLDQKLLDRFRRGEMVYSQGEF